MAYRRREGTRSVVLALILALGGQWMVHAQRPGLSTGSGVGTGAGAGAMSSANTGAGGAMSSAATGAGGAMSGRGDGPGTTLGGASGGVDALRLGPRTGTVPFGPGVDVSFPNDPYLLPFLMPEESRNLLESKAPTGVTPDLLANARLIADPAERSLALRQIANGAMLSNQLFLAHNTLEEAITAASQVTVPLVRDQRLIGLVTSTNLLTSDLLRVARENLGTATAPELEPAQRPEAGGANSSPPRAEPTVLIRLARLEWRRGLYLAGIIGNPTYRNEMLYRVAESQAMGSAAVANLAAGPEGESLGNRPGTASALQPSRAPFPAPSPPALRGGRPDRVQRPEVAPPAPLPAAPAPASPPEGRKPQDAQVYDKLADEILLEAWDAAKTIDRFIWRYRAMVRIALSASDSHQYARGIALARTIENAESRAEALILLAEAECRNAAARGTPELAATATEAYQAAAEAVAAIPQDGLRGVITGILVDSLIAVGRFDDARACTVIHPDQAERFVELGAIAESQGRRGAADDARRWIATEAPEGYRSALYRRVAAGVLWAVEQNRSRELTGGETLPPGAR